MLSDCTPPDSDTNFFWNCTVNDKSKECRITCKNGAILLGADTVTCDNEGWKANGEKIDTFPYCRGISHIL